jgi:hypothetical protein
MVLFDHGRAESVEERDGGDRTVLDRLGLRLRRRVAD